jgi:hypothetical protein
VLRVLLKRKMKKLAEGFVYELQRAIVLGAIALVVILLFK